MKHDGTLSARERLGRARRLGATVGRIYLGLKANQLLARRLRPSDMPRRWRRFHHESAHSVYRTAVELRGLVLKGCQYVGTRADLLPREWVTVLSRLQDRVPPKDFRIVRRTVERELGRPLESVFRSFASRPVAAASLAQVHQAVLRDGRRVAVKVQYPEIEALIASDLANLYALLRTIGWLERDFDPIPVVNELAHYVARELDFLAEAENAERIARQFARRADVCVPPVHRDVSTRRLLVMDFVDGIKITDRIALQRHAVDREQVARLLVSVYAEQILVHGFFHADPHPGNLLVEPNGPGLVLLDFGLAKDLPPGFRARVAALLLSVLRGDARGMGNALHELGFETRTGSPEALQALAELGIELAREVAERGSLGADALERVGREFAERIRRDPVVRVPSHFVLLGRTLGLLSGVSRSLGVQIDPLRIALPYAMSDLRDPQPGGSVLGAAPPSA